ncbi:MAG: M23 family metallopeptidase [Bacteroidia bacterium]|nr:M23 family metallopeptidase [Bacteroidia bacterium]
MVKYFFFFLSFMMINVSLCQSTDILEKNRLAITEALTTLNHSLSGNKNNQSIEKQSKEIDRLFEKRDSILNEYKDELNKLKSYLGDTTALNRIEKDSSIYYAYADFLRQSHIEDIAREKQAVNPSEQWAYKKYIRDKINHYYNIKLKDSISFATKSKKEYDQAFDKWQMEMITTDSLRLSYNSLKRSTAAVKVKETVNAKTEDVPIRIKKLQQRFEKIRRSVISVSGAEAQNRSENIFEQKRGFHRWPVTDPALDVRYGNQKEKETGHVYFNPGVNIHSKGDNLVKSIFEGTVVALYNLEIDDYTVIIRHDNDYYSVYSGLSFSNMNIDDRVSTQQVIGLLPSSDSGYSMHLQLWENNKSVNPIHWLKNRTR